ncbi:MAG: DUF2065 domain-containing protein [Gammaproteobacteria bacterium]|nr:DUF2065 domain-containing protein [Pseudomonadota bacterium]MCH9663241.1 DUF2065 domain-containing protein [Gammaproteobacteria bacterium]
MAQLSLIELIAYFVGLFLIAEGLMPFFFTNRFRAILSAMLERDSRDLQRFGGLSILAGCAVMLLLAFI